MEEQKGTLFLFPILCVFVEVIGEEKGVYEEGKGKDKRVAMLKEWREHEKREKRILWPLESELQIVEGRAIGAKEWRNNVAIFSSRCCHSTLSHASRPLLDQPSVPLSLSLSSLSPSLQSLFSIQELLYAVKFM